MAALYGQVSGESVTAASCGFVEILSMCRTGSIQPDAVIDIKSIPECRLLSVYNERLHIGFVCSLNQISESKLFPLMRLTCGRIADHTNQCRITLGGNLCGSIIYRETSLPLLISDADITLYGPDGERTVPFGSVFHERMRMKPGEMIVQVNIPVWALSARYSHIKKTANEKIDYPLVSVAALWKDDNLRIAFSGLCSYPFRNEQIENALNERTKPITRGHGTSFGFAARRAERTAWIDSSKARLLEWGLRSLYGNSGRLADEILPDAGGRGGRTCNIDCGGT